MTLLEPAFCDLDTFTNQLVTPDQYSCKWIALYITTELHVSLNASANGPTITATVTKAPHTDLELIILTKSSVVWDSVHIYLKSNYQGMN